MIAASGLDLAAWDTLARAADVPLAVLLGGLVGPVAAYNSNGLWLKAPAEVAEEAMVLCDEGGFGALKLRLRRERLSDDLATVDAVRRSVGEDIGLMVDFDQGLHIGEALTRCHAIDNLGLAWIEEPIVYNDFAGYAKLAADLKTPLQIGENFYGPRDLYKALQRRIVPPSKLLIVRRCDTNVAVHNGPQALESATPRRHQVPQKVCCTRSSGAGGSA